MSEFACCQVQNPSDFLAAKPDFGRRGRFFCIVRIHLEAFARETRSLIERILLGVAK